MGRFRAGRHHGPDAATTAASNTLAAQLPGALKAAAPAVAAKLSVSGVADSISDGRGLVSEASGALTDAWEWVGLTTAPA